MTKNSTITTRDELLEAIVSQVGANEIAPDEFTNLHFMAKFEQRYGRKMGRLPANRILRKMVNDGQLTTRMAYNGRTMVRVYKKSTT